MFKNSRADVRLPVILPISDNPERPGVTPGLEPPYAQPTKDLNKQPTQERDAVASDADLDRELAAARAGDRSGLDGALDF